ncbi:MAG: Gfo/Idh/MocA family oxidoreductase [Coriobacteriales bacterium]|nr:Gfo/Idh/MocA family oxidoreductase [Coriobacteriales bacterium]
MTERAGRWGYSPLLGKNKGEDNNMKLGIVGTGMIVRMVGPHLASWGIGVAAVAGTPRSVDAIDELADEYGAAGRYTDWRDLVADPAVDTVYVAVPNFLHYAVSEAALLAGKDVICEKPLASNYEEASRLAEVARTQGRFLWEAVVTTRQPNFKLVRDELIPRIGTIKAVSVNYSQYSSRYDAFRAGEVLPAFDPAKAGGAIMDIGLYTLTYTIGLFGEPKTATYHANIERGIDTSGLVVMGYDGFTATNVCAKDSWGATGATIQGTDGYISVEGAPNACGAVTLRLNDGTEETFDRSYPVMWEGEFREFLAQQGAGDLDECYRQLDQSLLVSRVQNAVRREAGVIFPADER